MNRTSLFLSLSLLYFFSLSIFCMEEKHPLAIPDVTRLVAYFLVDSFSPKQGNFEEPPHKQLLTNIRYFSKTNKQIYSTMRNLTHGSIEDKSARAFNELLIKRLSKLLADKQSPECLAAAYLATPFALNQLHNDYISIIEVLFEKKDKLFQKKLDAQMKTVIIYKRIYDGPPSGYLSSLVCYNRENQITLETYDETLAKFPRSTRFFCKKLTDQLIK